VVIQLEINMLLFLLDRDGFGSSRGYKKIWEYMTAKTTNISSHQLICPSSLQRPKDQNSE
jgi:hypothetical protein